MIRAKILSLISVLMLSAQLCRASSDPVLSLNSGSETLRLKASELLRSKDVETVTVAKDVAYGGAKRSYQAIAMSRIFNKINLSPNAVIEFRALDGFSAVISKERLLNNSPIAARAYLAVESSKAPWPPLKPGARSAGPFYVIWTQPERSEITADEWPYQIESFSVRGELEKLYPAILPDEKLSANDPARRGFKVFIENCFACHTLNKQGSSQVGPDLNLPMNPTEYFKNDDIFRRYVRNPQNLRHWPQSRMPPFPEASLSESKLTDLIYYLKHMSGRKTAQTPAAN